MASFAKASFRTSLYHAARPTYPPRLIDLIHSYHRSPSHSINDALLNDELEVRGRDVFALDLGCGTGEK